MVVVVGRHLRHDLVGLLDRDPTRRSDEEHPGDALRGLARVGDSGGSADAVTDQDDALEIEAIDDRTDVAGQVLDRIVGPDIRFRSGRGRAGRTRSRAGRTQVGELVRPMDEAAAERVDEQDGRSVTRPSIVDVQAPGGTREVAGHGEPSV